VTNPSHVYKHINNFIIELKTHFPHICVRISEVSYDDSIILYHDHKHLDDDPHFIETSLNLLEKYFDKNGIINVGFSPDYLMEE
jgi:hypothetical protein